MVHVGVKLFFYNPAKSTADETARRKELDILVKFFKQLQASATGIWISKEERLSHNKHN